MFPCAPGGSCGAKIPPRSPRYPGGRGSGRPWLWASHLLRRGGAIRFRGRRGSGRVARQNRAGRCRHHRRRKTRSSDACRKSSSRCRANGASLKKPVLRLSAKRRTNPRCGNSSCVWRRSTIPAPIIGDAAVAGDPGAPISAPIRPTGIAIASAPTVGLGQYKCRRNGSISSRSALASSNSPSSM